MYKAPYIVLKAQQYLVEDNEARVKFDACEDLIGVYETQKDANKAYSSVNKKNLKPDETIIILALDSGTDWPDNDGTYATQHYIGPMSYIGLLNGTEEYVFSEFQNLIFVRSSGSKGFAGSHANWRRNGSGHLTRAEWPVGGPKDG